MTKLIVKYYHEKGNHNSGTNQTLSMLSTKYWIIAAHEEIMDWEREHATCKRRKARQAEQFIYGSINVREESDSYSIMSM